MEDNMEDDEEDKYVCNILRGGFDLIGGIVLLEFVLALALTLTLVVGICIGIEISC